MNVPSQPAHSAASVQADHTPLPSATLDALRQFSQVAHERGHAQIWALNFWGRHGHWPTSAQILIGLRTDMGLSISRTTAWRALKTVKPRS